MTIDDPVFTRVCYIEDIAKMLTLYRGEPLTAKEFDILYDSPEDELIRAYDNIRQLVNRY